MAVSYDDGALVDVEAEALGCETESGWAAGRVVMRDSGESNEAATYAIIMEEDGRTVPQLPHRTLPLTLTSTPNPNPNPNPHQVPRLSHRALRLRCSYPGCLKHALPL